MDAVANNIKGDFFFQLRYTWDAIAYDLYEPGSKDENLAGSFLCNYYHVTHEPTIKLSDPQIRILDALTEAVGIPHQKGQREIEIPERLKHYNKWVMSKDYEERVGKAKAKK